MLHQSPYISLHSSQITTQPNGYFYFFLITKVTFLSQYTNDTMTVYAPQSNRIFSFEKVFRFRNCILYIY